jgi:hypothetical protein
MSEPSALGFMKTALYQMVLHRPFEPTREIGKIRTKTYFPRTNWRGASVSTFWAPQRHERAEVTAKHENIKA